LSASTLLRRFEEAAPERGAAQSPRRPGLGELGAMLAGPGRRNDEVPCREGVMRLVRSVVRLSCLSSEWPNLSFLSRTVCPHCHGAPCIAGRGVALSLLDRHDETVAAFEKVPFALIRGTSKGALKRRLTTNARHQKPNGTSRHCQANRSAWPPCQPVERGSHPCGVRGPALIANRARTGIPDVPTTSSRAKLP
jgi:hypothetical protein